MPSVFRKRAFVLLGSMALAALIAGCGKSDKSTANPDAPTRRPRVAVAPGSGVIRGKVVFDGTPPQRITLIAPNTCHEGSPALLDETVIVNPDGAFTNVIVYIKDGPPGDGGGPAVVIDQKDCHYIPHVVALQVFQPLVMRNSDPKMHNVHFQCQINREESFGMDEIGDYKPIQLTAPEFFPIKCDVHPWMDCEVAVFDHPYFAVTGDDGAFEIKNVPPGTYTLVARQERYGELSQQVTVADKKTTDASFTYKKP